MKLKKLIEEIDYEMVKGSKSIPIGGICSHSKRVRPGDLFIAKKGGKFDGCRFIPDALDAGASAILTDIYNPFLSDVVQIIHKDVERIEPLIAARFYGDPSKKLFMVGVTGTCGKTTTAYLVRHLLGESCGLIGTIETIIGDHHLTAELTTPDSVTCQKLLGEMVASKCDSAVMEVSSHGIDQNRVAEIDFDVGIYTNLSPEHLDYHETMEEYASVKARLFQSVKKGVFNGNDAWTPFMLERATCEKLIYTIDGDGDLNATNVQMTSKGLSATITYRGESVEVQTALIGLFNLSNFLAATGAALLRGMSLEEVCKKIEGFTPAPGRLQRVEGTPSIYIDYAHKPDALEKVLKTLREIARRKMITCFGCGGDRDRAKRPLMMQVAEKYSDVVIVTNDNPRHEDPEAIAQEIVAGARKKPIVELDRRKAIARAIELAEDDDLILVAGKGHETMQIIGDRSYPFDDYQTAKELLQ